MKYNNIHEKLLNDFEFIYFANDVYQGTGPEFYLKNYHIVTFDNNPLVELVRQTAKVFTVEEADRVKNETFRNSYNLTQFPCVLNYINSVSERKKFLVFKNSARFISASKTYGWDLCASPPALGRYFENKLKSSEYFKKLGLDIPRTKILKYTGKNLSYSSISRQFGDKFVIQLAKGFGGSHTFIINSQNELNQILPRIQNRDIKISEFISGINITMNACVTSSGILTSKPFQQLTGIELCTKNKAGAIGNQWDDISLPLDYIKSGAVKIGKYMAEKGYRGIFGLDLVVTTQGKVYFIENNARMVNSIPFFTQLQIINNEIPLSCIHLLEFTNNIGNININELNKTYTNNLKGAQIILHNKENKSIKIYGTMKPGIYSFVNNILTFNKTSYKIMDCKSPEDILILPKEIDRIINPEMEVARIQTPYIIADHNGKLLPYFEELIKTVYSSLDIIPYSDFKILNQE